MIKPQALTTLATMREREVESYANAGSPVSLTSRRRLHDWRCRCDLANKIQAVGALTPKGGIAPISSWTELALR